LEKDLWRFIEEVQQDERERGLMFNKQVYLLKEEDNHIDQDEAAQAETEDLEKLSKNIAG